MEQRPLLNLFFALLFCAHTAHAQSRIQPVDLIEATPITTFSEETGSWPAESVNPEILHTSALSLFETLDRIPGVATRGSLSKGSPGFLLHDSASATRTLGLFDGIPLNLGDSAGTQELLVPREMLSDIVILKGPSSLFYGSGAMSGALNFIPSTYNRARVRGSVGSFGERSIFGAIPVLATSDHHVQITAFDETLDGDYPYTSLSTMQSGQRRRTDASTQRSTLLGQHRFGKTSLAYHAVLAQEFGSGPGPERTSARDSFMARKQGEIYALKIKREFDSYWSAQAAGSIVRTKNRTFNDGTNTKSATDAYQSIVGTDVYYNTSKDTDFHLLMDAKEDFYSYSSTADVRKSEKSYEPGLVVETPFAENIRLLTGARYLPEFGVLNKAFGVRQIRGPEQVWLSYAEGFNKPSLSDKYAQDSFFVGNPDLKPEVSKQVELGGSRSGDRFASHMLERFSYSGTAYSTSYEDLFTYTSPTTGPSTKRNLESANAFGFDTSAGYPLDLWGFEAGYSYVDFSSKGKPLPNVLEQSAFAAISHYFGPLVFELRDNQVISYRYRQAANDFWEWNTLDFTFRTVGLNDWILHGGVLNILDQSRMFTIDYPEPQRRFFLSAERIF